MRASLQFLCHGQSGQTRHPQRYPAIRFAIKTIAGCACIQAATACFSLKNAVFWRYGGAVQAPRGLFGLKNRLKSPNTCIKKACSPMGMRAASYVLYSIQNAKACP
ncbi:MAG: hypothetical protein V4455_15365, partial [Pseudomonadota bacterium]